MAAICSKAALQSRAKSPADRADFGWLCILPGSIHSSLHLGYGICPIFAGQGRNKRPDTVIQGGTVRRIRRPHLRPPKRYIFLFKEGHCSSRTVGRGPILLKYKRGRTAIAAMGGGHFPHPGQDGPLKGTYIVLRGEPETLRPPDRWAHLAGAGHDP